MRYTVYGVDAASQAPREPLVVDADTEEEARVRAVARGMAVRAVVAEPGLGVVDERPTEPDAGAWSERHERPTEEAPGLRYVRMVLVPLVLGFFLILAALRTLVQALVWAFIWSLGLLLGGGLAGMLRWFSRGDVPVETAWPIGLDAGLALISALYGSQLGWRWWWAKRSLSPLEQALGVEPHEGDDGKPASIRAPVLLAQGFAGAVLGTLGGLAGWASDWSPVTVLAWTAGGALGLGAEGAVLGTILARRRPLPPPGAVSGTSFESLAGLLARLWGQEHLVRSLGLAHALDRAAPGAVAGTFAGVVAVLLAWLALGTN